VGEEVLLALIEIDQRVFPIDPATVRTLKDAGVSEKVIVAIVKSGRTPAAQPAPEPMPTMEPMPVVPDPSEPRVVVVERERPVVREVGVPVPVYVPVPVVRHSRTVRHDRDDHDEHSRKPVEPVYWGWGGKLRPDAWQPSPADTRRERK
jgi:hypothetical protein